MLNTTIRIVKMLNRRGHIPTMLLFVVGLVLVLTAWWTFLSYDSDVEIKALEISSVIQEMSFKKVYVEKVFERMIGEAIIGADESNFEETFSDTFEELGIKRNPGLDFGNFFGKIRNGDYSMVPGNGVYSLTIENVFVSSKVGNHELRREFNLSIRFDENRIIK